MRWVALAMMAALLGAAPGRCQDASPSPIAHRAPSLLDTKRYQAELAAAKDESERTKLLHERWEAVKRAIHHSLGLQDRGAFHSTLQYWQTGYPREAVILKESLAKPLVVEANPPLEGRSFSTPQLTIIQGDCLADVTLAENANLHIYGDLHATIRGSKSSEILIAGSVQPKASIDFEIPYASNAVFMGGDLQGRVNGCTLLWVHGNLSGEVRTSRYSTRARVMGNFSGLVKPAEQQPGNRFSGGELALEIDGFASYQALEAIAQHGYRTFKASVRTSDSPPGIFTTSTDRLATQEIVIHHQAR